ncbi:IMPACT family protein [Rhizobium oryzicola]|uniref:YigZ family protein n=1 Tax=Rhizobium oryzicola TaxID=1232668 RepID=A0ABT8T376_9HYPH|nr:YigZ family protein [Rhizobium oryzicola]MDO1584748.1 YigZ family protein [Rhizobium oryzicola]
MFTLSDIHTAEHEIKRSRFIAFAGPVSDEAAAKAFIAEHSDGNANHNCWAWRLAQNYRFSDDGEPSGTAGKPILQAIDGQDLDGVAVVVARWFGGTLLGSGGLIRAYGGTAAECLRLAPKSRLIAMTALSVTLRFADLAVVKARISAIADSQIVSEVFTDTGARLDVRVPRDYAADMIALVTDLTAGRAVFEDLDR